jgi:heterodisulfide reductase subunit B
MVTLCPACHQVLDGNQRQVERRFKETYNLPVFHYPQLLGLAMGIPADELAIADLRVKATKVLTTLV